MTAPLIAPGRFTTPGRATARRAGTLVTLVLLGACATTVDDDTTTDTTASSDVTTEPIEEPARPPVPADASAGEWLPELALEMSGLGSQIADGDEADATFARIEAIWAAIRAEIEARHPELISGFGSTIDMARTAVERTRPADADKAFSILNDLLDRYDDNG